MKRLFLFLVFIPILTRCNKENTVTPKECSTPATIKNLTGLDGCGYVFELADKTIIEPYRMMYCGIPLPKEITEDPSYKFNWVDGKKVMISYTIMDSIMSICMAGRVAKITCIQDLEPNKTCLQNLIDELKNEDVRNPPAKIYQYTFYDNIVYFIPQYCCDFPSVLMDKNCNVICNPDGGITGNGDGRCNDFFQKRKNEKIVWSDDRVR